MVKHIFLTCGVLLSATAQTAFAKELEGMLVTQNNYVRIRSCDLKTITLCFPVAETAMKPQRKSSASEKIRLKTHQSMSD